MAIKFIIEHGHTKREITGPFNLCMDNHTAQLLYSALRVRLDASGGHYDYGWMSVCEQQPSILNTNPEPWETAGGES